MLGELHRRLERLDKAIKLARSTALQQECICRGVGRRYPVTRYHTAEELDQILAVPCPVHGIRDPGFIWWVPERAPLVEPDRGFCNCPPNFYRDAQSGKIPLPIDLALRRKRLDEEIARHNREQEQRTPEGSERDFKEFQAKVSAVIAAFEARVEEAQRRVNGN